MEILWAVTDKRSHCVVLNCFSFYFQTVPGRKDLQAADLTVYECSRYKSSTK